VFLSLACSSAHLYAGVPSGIVILICATPAWLLI
jgi:hypothetical protein